MTAKSLSAKNLDVISKFELEAYAIQMEATYLIEIYKYEPAMNLLLRTKFIYEQILEGKDLVEQAIYKEKISQIDTFVRHCS